MDGADSFVLRGIFESFVEQREAQLRARKFTEILNNRPGLGTSLNDDYKNMFCGRTIKDK